MENTTKKLQSTFTFKETLETPKRIIEKLLITQSQIAQYSQI